MRILILGGYGQFGGRIARTLAADTGLTLVIAGRDSARAAAFVRSLGTTAAQLEALALDVEADDLETRIAACRPALVIHTAGPFQQRDYRVARAALACAAHYVDLADGRAFVAGIDALDAHARRAGRHVIAGASSVPGLSGAVVAAHEERFSRLTAVEAGVSPGNRTPRGLATTRAILGYVGQPWQILTHGTPRTVHGWQALRRVHYPGVGTRWLARCEVPDLDVLPRRYPQLRRCDFHAGLELRRMHHGLWLASWLVRAGLLRSMSPWAKPLLAISERWLDAGSDTGVMHVDLHGLDPTGKPLGLRWMLIAEHGDGPQIPCVAAAVLARKLAAGSLSGAGARACMDVFTLDEFLQALDGFAVRTELTGIPAHP